MEGSALPGLFLHDWKPFSSKIMRFDLFPVSSYNLSVMIDLRIFYDWGEVQCLHAYPQLKSVLKK